MHKKIPHGFGLIEIIIVATLMGMTSGLAVPAFVIARTHSRLNTCTADRQTFEKADASFEMDAGYVPSSIEELFTSGYVNKSPICPSGGTWSWDDDREYIACSIHGGSSTTDVGNSATISALSGTTQGRWFRHADSISTNWGGQAVSFKVDLEESGDYYIDLAAINNAGPPGWTKVDGYRHFHIKVKVDGKTIPSLDVPVSDTEYKIDTTFINSLKAGEHTFTFVWQNDVYKPAKHQDNNIRIREIVIRKKEED